MDTHITATPALPAVNYLTSTAVKSTASLSHRTHSHVLETQVQLTALEQVQKDLKLYIHNCTFKLKEKDNIKPFSLPFLQVFAFPVMSMCLQLARTALCLGPM